MKHRATNSKLHHCACSRVARIRYPQLRQIRADQREILNFILEKQEVETAYRSAEETCERVGISESTLLRCQRRGEIAVAKMVRGRKYFRDRDVERLRKAYWGR